MILSETWFMEGFIDFELQKYKLLAYLQDVDKCFNATKLYPQLADVIFHYNNLVAFRDNKRFLQDNFPKQISQVNVQKLEIVYDQILQDDEMMQELENITLYAVDKIKHTISNGTEIYELVEQHMHIEPIGIMPLYKNEGYMLLRYGTTAEIRVYNYTISLFEHKDAVYKGIKIAYLDSWQKSLVHTYESIKIDIIRNIRTLPNPAVYSIEYPMSIPFDETLLPVAKRLLVKHITDKAA